MIKHFAKGHQCPSSPFRSFFLTHYIFETYYLTLITKIQVSAAYVQYRDREVVIFSGNLRKKDKCGLFI